MPRRRKISRTIRIATAIAIVDADCTLDPREEPFTAQLTAVLQSLIARERDPFLVLERPDEPQHFTEAYFDSTSRSHELEYRDGGPDQHCRAVTDDVVAAANVLAVWVDRIEGWCRSLQWELVTLP